MSILDDGKPVPISRFAGQVDYQGPQKVINGCAIACRNIDFLPELAKTRFGTRTTMARQQTGGDVSGIDVLEVLGINNPGEVPICFTALGELLQESPPGSGAFISLTPPFPLPTGARMQTTQAQNALSMAFTDGQNGLMPPIQYYGPTKQVSPISQNIIGALWKAGVWYRIGDMVRSQDGRWWKCTTSATAVSTSVAPVFPQFNGFFQSNGAWVSASVSEPISGSFWVEWTPACEQFVPAPYATNGPSFSIANSPGSGTIPAGKDVYIKLTYYIAHTNAEGPRSVSNVFGPTGVNDQITLQFSSGGPTMPRWLAELKLNLQVPLFWPFTMNVWIAVVAHAAAPPADAAYALYASGTNPGDKTVVSSATTVGTTFPQSAAIVNKDTAEPVSFEGANGPRYMMMLRKDLLDSFYPVDPNAVIPVNLQGAIAVNILQISRTLAGLVTATVADITGFAAGQTVSVGGCTGDPTFNGSFTLTAVASTLVPQGQLTWSDGAHLSVANDTTGSVLLPAGPVPFAFIPECNNAESPFPLPANGYAAEDIAAFTVAGGSRAGPFFYLDGADPPIAVTQFINKLVATGTSVTATMFSADGIAAGDVCVVQNTPNATNLNGTTVVIASVTGNIVVFASTVCPAGTYVGGNLIVQQQLATTAASLKQAITAITRDANGNVTCSVPAVDGYVTGETVYVTNVANGSFNGLQHLTGVTLNPDQISGVLSWQDVPGAAANSAGGQVTPVSNIAINFDDPTLEFGINVTDQLGSLPAPNCSDIYFVPSLRMMAYVDNNTYPSAFVFSNTDDPANITGANSDPSNPGSGILSVDANAQKRTIGIREMRNGEILAVKENGGLALQPSALPPSAWQPARRWDDFGPVCAEAMCLSNSDESDFLAFAAEQGAFVYMGGNLMKLSREIAKTWKRFNLAAKATAACGIDVDRRKIHFLLPLDGATSPNYELVCSYYDGWGEPEVLNRYGKLITPRNCRKWSIQPLNALTCKWVKRTINGVAPANSVGAQQWPYSSANVAASCTFTFASLATVPPVQSGQKITSALTGLVTVLAVAGTTVLTTIGVAGAGAYGAANIQLVTQVLPPSTDQRVATRQFLYGAAGANAPLHGLAVQSLTRAGNIVTAVLNLAGYQPVQVELTKVIVTGAFDTSFNGVFTTTGSNIVGQLLTVTWNQVGPQSNSGSGFLFTTISMTRVTMIIPDVYDDDGIGIDSLYEPWLTQMPPAILDFLGFRGEIGGSGVAQLTPTSDVVGDVQPSQDIILPGGVGVIADPPAGRQFERVIKFKRKYCAPIITNKQTPGSYFVLIELSTYIQQWLTGTRGDR